MFNPVLHQHPDETLIMGHIVIGYGEIEFLFGMCAGIALEHKNVVLRAFHSIRGESGRIDLANALSVKAFAELGLKNEYAEAKGAVKFCLKVRNQYAHAQWGHSESNELVFAKSEDAFKEDKLAPTWRGLTLGLLKEQEAFFAYTRKMLMYLEDRLTVSIATRDQAFHTRVPLRQLPTKTPLPNLYINLQS